MAKNSGCGTTPRCSTDFTTFLKASSLWRR
jgi:hypothetical protein